jgi:(p)ppGpp synthase/HD superfamily hydrolase
MSPAFGVEEAIALARWAHAGQTDKAGRPYIEHPLRVMHRLRGEYEQMAAILHDVLEDTPITEDDLSAAGCPEPVITAVCALTKHSGEPLEDSMARAATNPIACAVKRADIADNSDPARLALLDEATAQRLRRKYADSTRLLDRYASAAPGRTDGR